MLRLGEPLGEAEGGRRTEEDSRVGRNVEKLKESTKKYNGRSHVREKALRMERMKEMSIQTHQIHMMEMSSPRWHLLNYHK